MRKQSNISIQLEPSFPPPVEWNPTFIGSFSTSSSASSSEKHLAPWLPGCLTVFNSHSVSLAFHHFTLGRKPTISLCVHESWVQLPTVLICGGRSEPEWLNDADRQTKTVSWKRLSAADVIHCLWDLVALQLQPTVSYYRVILINVIKKISLRTF